MTKDDPIYKQAEYLSATLELTESMIGEMAKLIVEPVFDYQQIDIHIVGGREDDGDSVWLILNRRQIECLVDFLDAWLKRLPPRSVAAPSSDPEPPEASAVRQDQ